MSQEAQQPAMDSHSSSAESQDSPILMRRATAGTSGGVGSVQRFAEPSSPARQISEGFSEAPEDSAATGQPEVPV